MDLDQLFNFLSHEVPDSVRSDSVRSSGGSGNGSCYRSELIIWEDVVRVPLFQNAVLA